MPTAPDIPLATQRLREGGIVAFPTETVYGLGADARNPAAVQRVFDLKQRPSRNPLIVHVDSIDMARACAARWTDDADALARAFWPGPLTLVLPKADDIPPLVTAGGPTVALRQPDHPLARDLIRAFGGPIVGPSANPSGHVSPTTAQHVRDAFPERDVLVLDGGPCRVGIESTVVSLAGGTPRLLRLGAVSKADLERVLGKPVPRTKARPSGPLESPGQLEKHYAPDAPAVLCRPRDLARALTDLDGPAIVLGPLLTRVPLPHRLIPMPADPAAYAARLYAALREADALFPARIVILDPRDAAPGDWDAILDRLTRACA